MKLKEYISEWQLIGIIIGFTLGTSIIYCLSYRYSEHDAWLSEIAALFIGIVIILMTAYVSKTCPQQDLNMLFASCCNKYIGKLLLICIFLFSFIISGVIIKEYQIFMNLMVMQETPAWVFITTLSIVIGILIRYGVEVFARCVEIMIPLIVGTLIILIIITSFFIEVDNLFPLFTEGIIAHIQAVETTLALPYFELPLLLFIFIHLKNQDKAMRAGIIGLLIGGFFLVTRPLYVVLMFGAQSTNVLYPVYSITRHINLGEFLGRIELLMLIVWFLAGIIKLGVFIYTGVMSLKYILDLQDYKTVILPYVVCLIPVALKAYGNFQETTPFLVNSLVILEFILVLLPLLYIFLISRQVAKLKLHKLKKGGN